MDSIFGDKRSPNALITFYGNLGQTKPKFFFQTINSYRRIESFLIQFECNMLQIFA